MWGVDDEIRDAIKEVRKMMAQVGADKNKVAEKAKEATDRVIEMIFKEEKILFPMALETLTEDEWAKISEASGEIGYCLIGPVKKWVPSYSIGQAQAEGTSRDGKNPRACKIRCRRLSPEINAMLNTLPIDITFVDRTIR